MKFDCQPILAIHRFSNKQYLHLMKAILSLLIIFSSVNLNAQQTMIVYLKDKQEPTVQELESRFTDRALARRAKNHVEFDSKDWPVNLAYVNSLNSVGKILQISRWMNAVKFETSATENELLAQYDFIESIQTFSTKNTESTINKWEIEEAKTLNYGYADTQVTQINVDCLHDLGYTGEGVFVAIIDAGFNGMDTIPYFDSVYLENRLIDFHDFINDSTVYAYSGHGTAVASTIVAEMQGVDSVQYTGTGKDVDIALYVSEDVSSETQLEEFNLVAALERSDSVGVDVVNISLGYYEFDDSLTNYIYDDLDGQTTISAVGVTTAASKGIVVVTSAGNSGPDHITTPGDADSILTVGAIEGFGNYAWFSGVGPSFDGRVKPDVVARGGDAWFIRSSGELDYGNGTSFSSPITAGAVACLVGANPTMTAQEIIQTIRESASQVSTPDSFTGYGIPDFCALNLVVSTIMGPSSLVYPVPADNELNLHSPLLVSDEVTLSITDMMGRLIEEHVCSPQNNGVEISTIGVPNGHYFVSVLDDSGLLFQTKIIIAH